MKRSYLTAMIVVLLLLYSGGIQAQTTNNQKESVVAYEVAGMTDVIIKTTLEFWKFNLKQ